MQSTIGKEKVKQMFQTKKCFIACSKLIINELRRCPTRSDDVYFANNERASFCCCVLFYTCQTQINYTT